MPLTVKVTADSAVAIYDTLKIRVAVPDAGVWGVRYIWFIDSPSPADTTTDSVLTKVFSVADTGRHRIVVRAVDRSGRTSPENSLYVNVTCSHPHLVPLPDTSVKVNDTLVLHFSAYDSVSPIAGYRYYFDNPNASRSMTGTTIVTFWRVADSGRHVLVVTAKNQDSVRSLPDTAIITVTYCRPKVRLLADSVVKINDTLTLEAQASDSDGTIDHYLWSIDGAGTTWFSTQKDSLRWVFGGTAESFHIIRVVAVDNDGLVSYADSVRVHVRLERPVVLFSQKDTTIYADRDLKLKATAFDSNGSIAEYRWMLDGRLLTQSLHNDTVTLRWGAGQAGTHLVTVTAVDNDSLESPQDSVLVTVLPGTPLVAPIHDTTISSLDTLKITCHASDPNGTIVKYLWNFSGTGWDDSTADSSHTLFYSGSGTVKVVVGARDNDGLVSTAAFTVTFNRPPDSIAVSTSALNDTIVLPQTTPSCTVSFVYSAHDPDNDITGYSLSWGHAMDSLSSVYQGPNQSAQVAGVYPGRYFWRLEARDSWGHVRADSGTVIVIRQYRICFIGHSIVVGVEGDGIVGGFRGGVLDSLRKTLGPYERLKAVGPTTTTYMSRSAADDSCMAIIGARAKDLCNTMTAFPSLTADIWVLMIGVNDSYNPQELSFTAVLMDILISRNLTGRLYVLNGNQLPSTYYTANYWLPSFNQGVTDAIATREAEGYSVFQVDAYTALSDSSGQYDSTLFSADGVHPNQNGYDRLRDTIFSTMENSNPLVIPKTP
jgi:lysophospholipase L1-like esterase